MKRHILKLFLLISAGLSLQSCFNLDEEVFDRVDKSIYYSDESSIKGAVAAIYNKAAMRSQHTSQTRFLLSKSMDGKES